MSNRISVELAKKLRDLVRALKEKSSIVDKTQPHVAELEITDDSFNAIESANSVQSPFGPVVTDWHYPMYPASLQTNLRNSPYPYSQAYASRIVPLAAFDDQIPKILYCNIDKRDKFRLKDDGIRVGTILYPNVRLLRHNQLQRDKLIAEVRVLPEIKRRFWKENDHYVTIAQVTQKYFKIIHE